MEIWRKSYAIFSNKGLWYEVKISVYPHNFIF